MHCHNAVVPSIYRVIAVYKLSLTFIWALTYGLDVFPEYQQLEHDSAIRVKLSKRTETRIILFVVFATDIFTATK